MKKHIVYILNAVLLLSACSCQRQKLEEPYLLLSHIPVSIDWSESLLDMNQVGNVSLYFYPKDGGEPIVKVSDDLYYNLVELPIGEYSVLIFNDMINNVTGISYTNEMVYNDFSVNRIQKANYLPSFYKTGSNDVFITPHSRMAGWHMDNFVVDESLVQFTRSEEFRDYISKVKSRAETRMLATKGNTKISKASSDALNELSNIITQPITTIIKYRVRVKNLNSAMHFNVFMKGTATGSYISKDENIPTEEDNNLYDLLVENREYDNPNKGIDGYVNFSLNTFGREPSNEKYELSFKIVLQTGELVEFERDITNQMISQEGHVIEIELDNNEDQLILPEYTKAGFNVNGWGDDITIYL